MRMFSVILILISTFCFNCKGDSNAKSERIATNLNLQSNVRIAITVPQPLEDKKLRVQFGGLAAERPPEVIFAVSLRCKNRKIVYHVGYLNFFNASGRLGRQPTFTFDLPDLKRVSCPSSSLYLTIQAEGVVTPGSFPRVEYVDLLGNSGAISVPRD